jgi:hypothetical protein
MGQEGASDPTHLLKIFFTFVLFFFYTYDGMPPSAIHNGQTCPLCSEFYFIFYFFFLS